jgi:hypothetical protein
VSFHCAEDRHGRLIKPTNQLAEAFSKWAAMILATIGRRAKSKCAHEWNDEFSWIVLAVSQFGFARLLDWLGPTRVHPSQVIPRRAALRLGGHN